MLKIQAGIKLLKEIEGYGTPISDSDRFNGVLQRNRFISVSHCINGLYFIEVPFTKRTGEPARPATVR